MTRNDLYCMAMESNTAGDNMRELCAALGEDYPPQPGDMTPIIGKTALDNLVESFEGETA